MSNSTIQVTEPLYDYLLAVSLREPELLTKLREETATMPGAGMQISPDQGQFLRLLIKMLGAKRTLEVGVFTGYSALSVALVLPDDGQIIACDVSEEYTSIARRYWHAAGIQHKIDLRLGPAVETLADLTADEANHGTFDFAFIDADKSNYATYYEEAFKLLRRGGMMAIDNVLWGGGVIDTERHDEDTKAIRELNRTVHKDDRVDISLVPIGDGIMLARKR
ncbi:MAG TPA: class I SAM-dependent methyltransferase [Caldilineaceae bacterium]|nr:class I SAM-dependent methyltransferase [Caldilineaceae bacterium]